MPSATNKIVEVISLYKQFRFPKGELHSLTINIPPLAGKFNTKFSIFRGSAVKNLPMHKNLTSFSNS